MRNFYILTICLVFTGCMSVEGINSDLAKIDKVWDVENKSAIAQRTHIVNADYNTTFKAVEKTFTDLDLPVVKSSPEKGFVVGKNEAPKPLTEEQWKQVVEVENPRMHSIAGWMYSLDDNPKGQFVNAKASVESVDNKTKVTLDYYINFPEYEDMGIISPKNVAPLAEKLACQAFWEKLDKNISISQ